MFAAGAAQNSTSRMFVFGGAVYDDATGRNYRPLGDLWAYSAATNRWLRLDSTTPGPSARSGSTMWVTGDRLYVFGGIDARYTTLNELWSYDLRRSAWSLVTLAGSPPPPRHLAQAGTVARFGRLTFYGGEGLDPQGGFSILADTWQIDLVRRRWVNVTPSAANPAPPRNYAATAVLGTGLYLQGGDIPGGDAGCGAPFPQNPVDDVWRFDLSTLTWRRVPLHGDAPVRIKRHSAATVNGRMYVVSGYDFHCADGTGQIWNHEVYSFTP